MIFNHVNRLFAAVSKKRSYIKTSKRVKSPFHRDERSEKSGRGCGTRRGIESVEREREDGSARREERGEIGR